MQCVLCALGSTRAVGGKPGYRGAAVSRRKHVAASRAPAVGPPSSDIPQLGQHSLHGRTRHATHLQD